MCLCFQAGGTKGFQDGPSNTVSIQGLVARETAGATFRVPLFRLLLGAGDTDGSLARMLPCNLVRYIATLYATF